jgi:hypothetical protein
VTGGLDRGGGRRARTSLLTAALALAGHFAAGQPAWPPQPSSEAAYDVVAADLLPLPAPALGLRFVHEARLLVLHADELALYRLTRDRLVPVDRLGLPPPVTVVRHAAGLLQQPGAEPLFWALVAGRPPALLVDAGRDRLVERARAAALPWPGAESGLQYRPGTDWLEGRVGGLGSGPFLALAAAATPAVGVDTRGELLLAGVTGPLEAGLRAGPALAVLEGPRHLAAASAEPPGEADSVSFVALAADGVRPAGEIRVPGAVRALASDVARGRLRLALALEQADGWRVALLELRRREELALP